MSVEPRDILDFWYSPRISKQWFSSTPQLDAEIRERFEDTWRLAGNGQLDSWRETADGCLALVIVLDQFPLNMYRGEARSFATEAGAIAVARQAISSGLDNEISVDRLAFLYMPFMHSEDMEDQDYSVALFEAAGLADNTRFARHHRDLVKRFGRFPHRNAILGRSSSTDELEYLNSDHAFKG